MHQFEYPENPQKPYGAQRHQKVPAGKKQVNITWQGREQVDNAVKTQCIFHRYSNREQPADIFKSEENRNDPFNERKFETVNFLDAAHALEHYRRDTDQYQR